MNKNLLYVTEKSKIKNKSGESFEIHSLKLKEVNIINPKENEILIRHEYIGLNFFDVDIARGIIKRREGFVPGIEASGFIEAIGKGVKKDFKKGDRVVYCTSRDCGAYSHYNTVEEDIVIALPDHVYNHLASLATLRGVFSHALLRRVFSINSKSIILIYGPNGALGHILSQWAKHLGATVIGVLQKNSLDVRKSFEDFDQQRALCEEYGCDLVLDYDDQNFTEKIMDFTYGAGVQVIYDSIGAHNLLKSIDIMQYCGLFVNLGQNSGLSLKISMQKAMEKSIFVTRPSIFDYKRNPNELRLTAKEFYDLVRRKIIKIHLEKIYNFDEMSKAHNDLIERNSNFLNIIKI